MAENFIQVLKDVFTDKAVEAVSRAIGEDASKTKAGLGAVIPTVLGGLLGSSANATSSPSWWQTISDLFAGDDDDDLKLGLLGDAKLGEAGKGLLGGLFGGNLDSIIGSVASAAGLSRTKAGSLLTTVAPMVIGFLTRWAKKKGLSFVGLIGKLLESKSSIIGALPAGLGAGLLGLKTDEPERPTYDDTTRKVVETQPPKPKFNWTWLLALLATLVILWLIFGRGCNRKDAADEINMKLSADRAKTAMVELNKSGVAANRLETEGYGSQHPICPANDTPECRAQNRRIDVRVTAK